MTARTRLLTLTLSTAALLIIPARWAGGQTAAEEAPPSHLAAIPRVPTGSAAFVAVRPLVDAGPATESPAFGSAAPESSRGVLPAAMTDRGSGSIGRSVAWGAVIGAAAGALTGLAVLAMCDSHCDDSRGRGMALHIGVGAVVGGTIGALVHRRRD